MSVREKTSWIAVITTLAIWSSYFWTFWTDVAAGRIDGQAIGNLFITCMLVSVVIMLGLTLFVAWRDRQSIDAPPDELERQIEGRADRLGFKLLELLVPVVLIGGLLNAGAVGAAFPDDPAGATAIMLVNAVLMAMVVVELVRETVKIVLFRMTA